MKEKILLHKLVISPESIETRGWSLSSKENLFLCNSCKSPYFMIRIEHGVIETESFGQILHYRRKPFYELQEIGIDLYCAECGDFNEDFSKWFYPKDKIVCSWDDENLDLAELHEIKHVLWQYNQKGTFTPSVKSAELIYLKEKLDEYEKKNYGGKKWIKGKKDRKKMKKESKKSQKKESSSEIQ